MKFTKNKLVGIVSVSSLTFALVFAIPLQTQALGVGNALDLKDKTSNKVKVEVSSETNANMELNNEDHEYKDDDRLPKGIRIAPGIEKRIEDGKGLPWGIWNKFFGHDNNDEDQDDNNGDQDMNDIVDIVIENPNLEVMDTTASFYFETNIETTGKLLYSTDSNLSDPEEVALESGTEHNVELNNLDDGTMYYIKVVLENNENDLTYESNIRSFTTEETDIVAPSVMFYHIFNVDSDSAYVIWITTEMTDSKVWVSTEEEVDTSVDATIEETDKSLFHVLQITDLEAETTYNVKVSSSDEAENETFSQTISFTTDSE